MEWLRNFTHNVKAGLSPSEEQKKTLQIISAMFVVICVLYQFRITRLILYPFEIISTVFHEFGHALVVLHAPLYYIIFI